jgi:hypothetical protein
VDHGDRGHEVYSAGRKSAGIFDGSRVSNEKDRSRSAVAAVRIVSVLIALGDATYAQSPTPGGVPPHGMSLAQSAAMRFPQPVRVGDLLHREVLEPVEGQNVLGTVREVVRDSDGTLEVVVEFGGFLGFCTRPIAVPVDAMALLGQDMEIVAFTPDQLRRFPTFFGAGATSVSADEVIKVGLAKQPGTH